MADDLDEQLRSTARTLAYGRMSIGAAALLAPRITGRIMGFPGDEMSASAVAMARFFAVRELVIGAVTLRVSESNPRNTDIYTLNAVVDGGDGVVVLATMLRRGPSRALLGSLAIAAPISGIWLWLRAKAGETAPE
jgi:hypothetical protein